ncbi:MAG: hypothetical protein JWO25_3203 [Alphaproteobacteria bacterium]|nr:hypothetical protein [Alphaproteobacteria bacterium]
MKPIAIGLLALAIAAPARAQVPWNPRAPENNQLFPAFSEATVGTVLSDIRARYQRQPGDAARPIIVATFPNGKRAVVSLLACTSNGSACKALGIQASWNPPAGAPATQLVQAVERFNQRYSFSKAYLTAAGRPALQRYLTADYGFIRGDLAVNLLVFADQEEKFMAEVLRPLVKP